MLNEMIKAFVGFRVPVEPLELLELLVRRSEGLGQSAGRRLKRLHFRRFQSHMIDHFRLC